MAQIKSEVVVIGGGVAGISAALELSKTHLVTILEKNQLLHGSSGRNPGRMGHGFHYIDFETAKLYLEASIQVQRLYPHFLIGEHLPFEHPLRHGRYYVTKTSLYSFAEVLPIYQKLQERYKELVEENSANKVFGEPESFMRILHPNEYQDHINADIIEGGVETCEHLFNWQAFSMHIRTMIAANPRIRLMEYSEVVDIAHHQELDSRFIVEGRTRHGEKFIINTNFIVNSAWENIEELNSKIGISYINGQRTNRLKCLVEVKLPSSLLDVNSSFFCMGAFCMFSNMGHGRGMLTLADVTNMEVSSARAISADMARYVYGDVSLEEKNRIGEEIKLGVARYIPEMIAAEILDVKFGIVQTKGEMTLQDLQQREGAHHARNYHAVREEMQGLISNPAMKFFYFVQNGMKVREIFETQLVRDLSIKETLRAMKNAFTMKTRFGQASFQKEIYRAIAIHLDKMSFEFPRLAFDLISMMQKKERLNSHPAIDISPKPLDVGISFVRASISPLTLSAHANIDDISMIWHHYRQVMQNLDLSEGPISFGLDLQGSPRSSERRPATFFAPIATPHYLIVSNSEHNTRVTSFS